MIGKSPSGKERGITSSCVPPVGGGGDKLSSGEGEFSSGGGTERGREGLVPK